MTNRLPTTHITVLSAGVCISSLDSQGGRCEDMQGGLKATEPQRDNDQDGVRSDSTPPFSPLLLCPCKTPGLGRSRRLYQVSPLPCAGSFRPNALRLPPSIGAEMFMPFSPTPPIQLWDCPLDHGSCGDLEMPTPCIVQLLLMQLIHKMAYRGEVHGA